jgi:geranylgeranyl pyrophosphate synthase
LGDLPESVRPAIQYALAGGGKRIRGLLLLAAYRAAGGDRDASELAASVEIIHAYSLVHDDLPCMDDDDMRRGRLATHKAFDVATAAAAGAAMIPLAAAIAHRSARRLELPEALANTIVKVLMEGAGASGMIGGQLLDLAGEGKALSREELDAIHIAKTGALIAASVKIGGIAAGAGNEQVEALALFGRDVGLAFQIMDDVLDVTSSTDKLGKIAGRDAELGKSTYPGLLGVEGAIARATSLAEGGCNALRAHRLLTSDLEYLAGFIVSRSH